MYLTLNIEEFLAGNDPILDVRSPKEFHTGHIPGAKNFPLFSDEERSVIGKLYKESGKPAAVRKGLEITGPKLDQFITKADKLSSENFRVHCWRGGMRSESLAWLLNTAGFKVSLLNGGYKAYRQYQLDFFSKPLPLRVVSGFTGSKKTLLLEKLRKRGEQVVDLEGIAKHQGSSFGNQKAGKQPTTEQFQNEVFELFRKFDLSRPIWMEDESMRIGTVNMLEDLYRQKSQSPHYVVEASREQRVEFLVEDYGKLPPEKLINATRSISKKLGKELSEQAIEAIGGDDLRSACEIILHYYDKRYAASLKRKAPYIHKRIPVDLTNIENAVDQFLH